MKKYPINKKETIITTCLGVAFCICLYFILSALGDILDWFNSFIGVITPFIWGFALAFFLTPLMRVFENRVFVKWNCKGKLKHNLSAFIALLIGLLVIAGILYIIVPQFVNSLATLAEHYPEYLRNFEKVVSDSELVKNSGVDVKDLMGNSTQMMNTLMNYLSNANVIPNLASVGMQFIRTVLNIIIALVSGLYMMMDKDHFLYQVRKFNYALFPKKCAVYFHHVVDTARVIFYDFIIGKAIDSLIIGILCYIGMMILNLPYAGLLSVIVGVTNMIPVFGPFIGAIPGIFILLIINPTDALLFAIFVLCLQQLDGNVIGPKILGNKLGLPSFWILFSVTFGGAIFGLVGMFFGVPLFALIYALLRDYVNLKLNQKDIPFK